jgi:hypothetical protein
LSRLTKTAGKNAISYRKLTRGTRLDVVGFLTPYPREAGSRSGAFVPSSGIGTLISMRQLLVTGIPGTGKTTVGDYLAAEHGFDHLDFEKPATLVRFFGRSETGFRSEHDALARAGRSVIVTWGFVPTAQLAAVLFMRELGFEWVWFDGNRDAARRAFCRRGTVPEAALDVQLAAIDQHIDLEQLRPRLLNTFDTAGDFRPLREIADELLAPAAASWSLPDSA